jgi:integrase
MQAVIGNALIANLKPKNKQYDVRDTKLKGFLIRVTPSGKMSYVCQYSRGRRINIGLVGVITPAQARDRAKEILADIVKGSLPNTKKQKNSLPTLSEFIEKEYAPWRHANRKGSKQDISRIKKIFTDKFGSLLLTEITPLLIDKWRAERTRNGIKSVTANRDIAVIKAMLSKAFEWKVITENPLQSYRLPSIDSIGKLRYLNKNEEIQLKLALVQRNNERKAARIRMNEHNQSRGYFLLPDLSQFAFVDHMTPMILVSLHTGLRQGELFSLQWQHVNFDQRILTVTGETAKSEKTRHVPLNAVAFQALQDWQSQHSGDGLVFANPKTGDRFNNVKKAWAGILKIAKIDNFRWHDMRHHFASKLVMAGVDLNTVRELLGHADTKMTLRYAHLAPEHKANAVAKLIEAEQ